MIRTVLPMINEKTRILEDGIALRTSDFDIVWVTGYGFPKVKYEPIFTDYSKRACHVN